jgi:Ca2+/Na+ antiporter
MLYQILKHAHSGLRWIVLILIVWAIINAITKINKKDFTETDRKYGLFALMATHIQFLIGLVLIFVSPLVKLSFYMTQHIPMMLLAVILITVAYSTSKRAVTSSSKFKKVIIFNLLGLLVMLAAIPWPFREGLGGGWY